MIGRSLGARRPVRSSSRVSLLLLVAGCGRVNFDDTSPSLPCPAGTIAIVGNATLGDRAPLALLEGLEQHQRKSCEDQQRDRHTWTACNDRSQHVALLEESGHLDKALELHYRGARPPRPSSVRDIPTCSRRSRRWRPRSGDPDARSAPSRPSSAPSRSAPGPPKPRSTISPRRASNLPRRSFGARLRDPRPQARRGCARRT